MPGHTKEDHDVGISVRIVVEVVTGGSPRPLGERKLAIVSLERLQKIQLAACTQIDARDLEWWRHEDARIIAADLIRARYRRKLAAGEYEAAAHAALGPGAFDLQCKTTKWRYALDDLLDLGRHPTY